MKSKTMLKGWLHFYSINNHKFSKIFKSQQDPPHYRCFIICTLVKATMKGKMTQIFLKTKVQWWSFPTECLTNTGACDKKDWNLRLRMQPIWVNRERKRLLRIWRTWQRYSIAAYLTHLTNVWTFRETMARRASHTLGRKQPTSITPRI